MDPLVVLFGLGVGLLVGATGIGGGSIMTPILILVLGTSPVVAIGTDVAYGAVTKTLGGWRHLRQGTVDTGVAGWLAVGSIPGALVGVWLVDRLASRMGDAVLTFVGVALLLAALGVFTRAALRRARAREVVTVRFSARQRAVAVGGGAVLGLILGLTSVGSGALVAPVLILVFGLTPMRVVGTDVAHAAMLLWAAGLGHLVAGNIDFGLMGNILLGSLPGVWVGASLVPRLPSDGLRWVLVCVLVASSIGVLSKAL